MPQEDRVIALRDTHPTSLSAALATLGESLEKATAKMDDVSLEIDVSGTLMHLRLRAYKHRDNGR